MNYVIFSSIDWNFNWQLPQQLASSLSADGNNVLYINNTGSRSVRINDLSRIKNKFLKSKVQNQKNLKILNPIFIPIHGNKLIDKLNSKIIFNLIKKNLNLFNHNKITIISFLPTRLVNYIYKKFNNSFLIYYLADELDFNHRYKTNQNILNYQKIFLNNSNLLFCTSHTLYEKYKKYNNHSYLIPSGVDYEKFNIQIKNNLFFNSFKTFKKPIIGYIGAVSYNLDLELIKSVALNFPNGTFVFVGPLYEEAYKYLNNISNIKLFKQVSHNQIPTIINSFDVGMIPYKINDFTNKIYPFKINEYLSVGLPVISTKTLEIEKFNETHNNIIEIINDTKEFINSINKLYFKKDFDKKKLIDIAILNSWENRMKKIYSCLEDQKFSEKTL